MRPSPAALLLAVALDWLAGEPPDRWHPVAWIGRGLRRAEDRARGRGVLDGARGLLGVMAVVSGVAAAAAATARRLGWPGVALEALLLKPAFAARRLATAAGEVATALRDRDLVSARGRLHRHLVSRDTRTLGAAHVASATVESVAENLTDSVAAPLLAYAVAGLPGAWAYRVLNTADAMWGYRDARYERFGKAAARLDDAANLVPALLAGAALVAGAAMMGEDARGALRVGWRDRGRTASPNAGWTMAAMAGALAVGLEKPGHYRLGAGPLPASPEAIQRAVSVFGAAAALLVGAAAGLALWRRAG